MINLKQYENNITFELNETLSFELGQEIEEMISISLDPDIIIQSYEDYIQIRGVIVLSGQYYRRDYMKREDLPRRKQHTFRYVEKVINEDEQTTSFSHRFPVEISVSKERINKVEDIVVTVDSFDYELPTSDTLQVYASLHIYGIIPEKVDDSTTETITTDKTKAISSKKEENNSTEMEVKELHSKGTERVVNIESKRNEGKKMVKTKQNDEQQLDEQKKDEKLTDTEEKPVQALKPEKETIETNTSDVSSENKVENINEDEEVQKVVKIDKKTEANRHRQQTESSENTQTEEAIQVELNEGLEDGESDIADVSFLTELFASEEETYTQVKIYIAQSDDTLEAIAKRYDVPVLQLLKDNQMSIDTIEEGQLITIRQRQKQ